GITTETETTGDGAYRLQQLPAGVYTLTVTAQGFKTAEITDVTVEVNTTTARDIVLEAGVVAETVTISAEGALTVQTETSDVGTVVTSKQVLELPLLVGSNGGFGLRSPEAFTFLTPGVVGPGTASDNGLNTDGPNDNGGTFQSKFAGSQNFANEVLLEGASTWRSENGSSFDETAPSVEAFQEFKVLTSNLSAEYGRTGGGITSFAYKSGTNEIHGSVYDYFRNRVLNANRFFNNAQGRDPVTGRERAPRPFDNFNDYGGTVGGPVYIPKLYDGRNRSFFFFIYEGSRRRLGGSSISTLPTEAFRRGDFSSLLTNEQVGTDALSRPVFAGQIFDPRTTRVVNGEVVRDPFPGNMIPEGRFSTVARNVLGFVPLPVNAGRFENFIFQGASPLDVYTFAIKGDHALTENSRLSGSYSKRVNDRVICCRALPDLINRGNQDQIFTTHYFRLTHDQTISPTVLNHFNLGVNRTVSINQSPSNEAGIPAQIGLTGVENTHFPEFNFGEGITGIGFGLSANNLDTGFRLNDFVSVIRGSHNLRFGVDFRHQRYTPTNQNNLAGTFNFGRGQTAAVVNNQTVGNTGFGFASFLLGAVEFANLNFAPNVPQWRTTYYAAFVQDDWKAARNLTLNLGLRYDVDKPRYELYDRYSSFSPEVPNPGAGNLPGAIIFAGEGPGRAGTRTFADTYYKAFGPRLGFAYSPDRSEGVLGKLLGGAGKTVFRGGYGIYYQALQYADFGERMQAGFKATPGFGSVNGFDPAFQLDAGFPQNFPRPPFIDPTVLNNPGSPQVVEFISPEHGRPGMIQNYGLEIQRELTRDLILNIGYIGAQGHRLRSNLKRYNTLRPEALQLGNLIFADINSAEARGAGIRPPFPGFVGNVAQALRPFPQYGDILTDCCLENAGNSTYNAGFVKIERRFSQGLNLLASYTFSKTLTDADSALPIFATFSGGGEVQNPYNLKSEKAVSNQDIPHALIISYIYELPFGKGRAVKTGNGFVDQVIGGWQVGAVHRYQSGQPLSFCCSSGIPTYGRIRPGLVPGQPILSEAVRNGTFDPGSPDPARRTYFNRAAFYDVNAICNQDARGRFIRNSPFGCRLPTEPFRFGDMPRTLGNVRSQKFFNEDINILKKTPINEEVTLEFRTEIFNIFNRVIFRSPNTFDATNPDPNSNFGRVFGQSNTPRVIQFALKLIF
ncbi:MAG TPA: TonB-dependent receptor, partial [Blastocatellia bacterium]|nr:TonB-dependent receptor [Blastocatellia bacterium]